MKSVNKFIKTIKEHTAQDDQQGVKCLIIDDSDIVCVHTSHK